MICSWQHPIRLVLRLELETSLGFRFLKKEQLRKDDSLSHFIKL